MRALTHGGTFHADDVFSAALLTIVYPDITIERRNTVSDDFDGIVFDIGGGRFDHHQADTDVRDNGVTYAAFGLLWREYGPQLVGEKYTEIFDREFVQMIDKTDNTGEKNPISTMIKEFNLRGEESGSSDEVFLSVVDIAKKILTRKIQCLKLRAADEEYLRERIDSCIGDILVLDRYASTGGFLSDTDIRYVIYPSCRGGYNINVAQSRHPGAIPKAWCGLSGEKLVEVSGMPGLQFCHRGGFLLVADTMEHAIQAVQKMEKREQRCECVEYFSEIGTYDGSNRNRIKL